MINFAKVPTPFFLEPNRLRERLHHMNLKIIDSFHKFRFDHYTPIINKHLGEEYSQGPSQVSKVLQKKRKKNEEDEDDGEQSDADTKFWPIERVYMQARDEKTNRDYVFVKWENAH